MGKKFKKCRFCDTERLEFILRMLRTRYTYVTYTTRAQIDSAMRNVEKEAERD